MAAACGHDDDGHANDGGNEEEVITTVELTFTPVWRWYDTVVASFNDPFGDGGDPPTIDSIELDCGSRI